MSRTRRAKAHAHRVHQINPAVDLLCTEDGHLLGKLTHEPLGGRLKLRAVARDEPPHGVLAFVRRRERKSQTTEDDAAEWSIEWVCSACVRQGRRGATAPRRILLVVLTPLLTSLGGLEAGRCQVRVSRWAIEAETARRAQTDPVGQPHKG